MNDETRLPLLKPCPFCGGRAVIQKFDYGGFLRNDECRIVCTCCRLTMDYGADKAVAIRYWNRRIGETKTKGKTE